MIEVERPPAASLVVTGMPSDLPEDTWVRVTGVWVPPPGGEYPGDGIPLVEIAATDIELLDEIPEFPYEYAS